MYGEVISTERLAPDLVRIILAGDGLAGFEPSPGTDSYVNVAIPPPGAPYAAPFAIDELKELPREVRPYRRRYTVRRWEDGELTLDFIVHGTGPGGAWAAGARPGDALVFTGPAGTYRPDPEADWHLFAGDESALPSIAASLEAVPGGVPAVVRLVCDGSEHEIGLDTPGALDLEWLHRNGEPASDADLLRDSIRSAELPAGRGHAFVHGEAGEIREVRRHLLADRGFTSDQLSCSPYWRRGMSDEEWRQVKAAWVADVERDVPV